MRITVAQEVIVKNPLSAVANCHLTSTEVELNRRCNEGLGE